MITLFQPRQSIVHRLHPLTKLTISFGLIVVALSAGVEWMPLALYLLALVPLSALAQVLKPFVKISLGIALPFTISLFIIQSLFFPEGSTIIARLGPLSIKQEGVLFAFAGSVRILLIAGALVLMLLTTHPGVLLTGLAQKGAPPQLAYVIATTLQTIPLLQTRAQQILDAQRARGLETEGSLLVRARALLPVFGPLVLSALIDVEERTLALEARAFSSPTPKTSLFDVPDTTLDRALRWGMLLAVVAVIAGRVAGVL